MSGEQAVTKALSERQSVAAKLFKHAEKVAERIKETESKEVVKVEDGQETKVVEDVYKLGLMHRTLLKLWHLLLKSTGHVVRAIAKIVNWLTDCFKVATKPISSAYEGLKNRVETEVKAAA